MEHLIIKYLQGSLTLEEQHRLSSWLQEDKKNVETLNRIAAYWNHDENLSEQEFEVRTMLHEKMARHKGEEHPQDNYRFVKLLARAAAIVLVLSALLYVYQHEQETAQLVSFVQKNSLSGQKITSVLPDGTIVKLNSNSQIIFPEVFDGSVREVELVGEAFFDVKKNPEKPFIVRTKNLSTIVLGTSFGIAAYKDDDQATVTLSEGSVNVVLKSDGENPTQKSIKLSPGEQAALNLSNNEFVKRDVDLKKFLAWKDGVLFFEREPLKDAFDKIGKWFGVGFEFSENISESTCELDGEFKDESLETVLQSISIVYDFEYEIINENLVKIKGEKCKVKTK